MTSRITSNIARSKTTTKLTKIGNPRGVRLPKALIEQAGLAYAAGDLELTEEDHAWLNMKSLPDELPADEDGWWL